MTYVSARKVKALEAAGYTVGKRNPKLNRAFKGKFMVADLNGWDGKPTDAANNGPQCIVGNDLGELVNEAYETWLTEEQLNKS